MLTIFLWSVRLKLVMNQNNTLKEKISNFTKENKWRILTAILLSATEIFLTLRPGGWIYVEGEVLSAADVIWIILIAVVTALGVIIRIPKSRYGLLNLFLLEINPFVMGTYLELVVSDSVSVANLKWNWILICAAEILLLGITWSPRVTLILLNWTLTIWYSADYYFSTFRGVPLRVNELTAVGTAAEVISGYDMTPSAELTRCWMLLVLFTVLAVSSGRDYAPSRRTHFLHALTAFTCCIFLGMGGGQSLLSTETEFWDMVERDNDFFQQSSYERNGYLLSTLLDIRDSRIAEPDGYSVENVEEILSAYTGTEESNPEEMPHVILILNETFSDLRVLGNLQLSSENMAFFNSLHENTIRGYVNASVRGGGTANSEFEVLTGCSMGFLPTSYYPYMQCISGVDESVVSMMKDNGYRTYSIHPAVDFNWRRNVVYDILGFDESFWLDSFEDPEVIHSLVSDRETYHKVEELYENRADGEKMFIFDLTIQNHGGYDPNETVTVTATNVDCAEANVYLSLIRESDEAFRELIEYFSEEEEKVIICMFGDHQPSFGDTDFCDNVFSQSDGLSETDKILNQYKTPFLIWANYDIGTDSDRDGWMDIGMSYLGSLLMETAGVEMSPYFYFLNDYRDQYPMITVNGYRDSEGEFFNWSGEDNEMPEYRYLQYNLLFGDTVEGGFSVKK